MMNREPKPIRSGTTFPWICGLAAAASLLSGAAANAQETVAVTARVTAIKGMVTASSTGSSERKLGRGDTIRSGTVVSSRAEAGLLLRPSPSSALVVYPASKVRFDGATVSPGNENVTCTIIEGKAWFSVGQPPAAGQEGAAAASSEKPTANVKISVVTPQGMIEGKFGNWTVQHDSNRTMVAVGEGKSLVTIGGATGAATGGINGQVEVGKGSVIWLYTREGGAVDAEVVNTQTGTVSKVGSNGTLGPATPAGEKLLADSKGGLSTPSSEGGTGNTPTTPTTQPTNTTPQNPDFSRPTTPLPVVSAEAP